MLGSKDPVLTHRTNQWFISLGSTWLTEEFSPTPFESFHVDLRKITDYDSEKKNHCTLIGIFGGVCSTKTAN